MTLYHVLLKSRGIVLPVVLVVLVLIGTAALMFMNNSMTQKKLISKSYERELCLWASDTIVNHIVGYVQKRKQDRKVNLIYADCLVDQFGSRKVSRFDLSELKKRMPELFQELQKSNVQLLDLEIRYDEVNPIRQGSNVICDNPFERFGKMDFCLSLQCRRTNMNIQVKREFRVLHMLPPVISQFTLFVKKPPEDFTEFNCISNSEQGLVSLQDGKMPLIFYHSNTALPVLENQGWVFLGGGRWELPLAAGCQEYGSSGKPYFGQSFQIVEPQSYFELQGVPTQKHTVIIKQIGFVDNDLYSGVFLGFPWGTKFLSSGLHLFGDNQASSPTLVLGQVVHQFLEFGGITWNVPDCDPSNPDFFCTALNYCSNEEDFDFGNRTKSVIKSSASASVNHDHTVNTNQHNQPAGFDCPGLSRGPESVADRFQCYCFSFYDTASNRYDGYNRYMSRIINGNRPFETEESIHYNHCYDRIVSGQQTFRTDPSNLKTDAIDPGVISAPGKYLQTPSDPLYYFYDTNLTQDHQNGNVKIQRKTASGNWIPLIDGCLGEIHTLLSVDPAQRVTHTVKADDFPLKCIRPRIKDQRHDLDVNGIVYIDQEADSDFHLSDQPLELKRGGWILNDGDIFIDEGIINELEDEVLVLCSINGDIVINTSKPVHASLVALHGSIRKTGNQPVTVLGNLVMDSLSPTLFHSNRTVYCQICSRSSHGSSHIHFDDRLSLVSDEDRFIKEYRVFISPENVYVQID